MSRKNRNSGRRPQARRRPNGSASKPTRRPTRPPVESLVMPRGRCYFRSRHGKLRFSAEEVEKALRQAQASRAARGSAYVEDRAYECPEGGCGDWHLTSRSEYQEPSR